MHGAAQGFIQGVSGGNFEQSFVTAMATSIAGDAFGLLGTKTSDSILGKALFGSVVGGITSNLQGGNFWEGATIGLTVSLLNCAGKKLYPAIDRMFQKQTLEKKIVQMIGKYKINEEVHLDDFGELLTWKEKLAISKIVRTSETNFKIYRTAIGAAKIASNAGFNIEKKGDIVVGKYTLTGLKITTYGLPLSQIVFDNGSETHTYNSFLVNGNYIRYSFKGKAFGTNF